MQDLCTVGQAVDVEALCAELAKRVEHEHGSTIMYDAAPILKDVIAQHGLLRTEPAPQRVTEPGAYHPDDTAIDKFAAAMKRKMAQKREQGRGGWSNPSECTVAFLSDCLRKHVDKGDPVDIGNFAMMLFNRNSAVLLDASGKSRDDYTQSRINDEYTGSRIKPALRVPEEAKETHNHVYGNMTPFPRKCITCGADEFEEIQKVAVEKILSALDSKLLSVNAAAADQIPYEEHERECLKLIEERDGAEEALSQAYYLVTGRSPQWSNMFGFEQALEDIGDAVSSLKLAVRSQVPMKPVRLKFPTMLRKMWSGSEVQEWLDRQSEQ